MGLYIQAMVETGLYIHEEAKVGLYVHVEAGEVYVQDCNRLRTREREVKIIVFKALKYLLLLLTDAAYLNQVDPRSPRQFVPTLDDYKKIHHINTTLQNSLYMLATYPKLKSSGPCSTGGGGGKLSLK